MSTERRRSNSRSRSNSTKRKKDASLSPDAKMYYLDEEYAGPEEKLPANTLDGIHFEFYFNPDISFLLAKKKSEIKGLVRPLFKDLASKSDGVFATKTGYSKLLGDIEEYMKGGNCKGVKRKYALESAEESNAILLLKAGEEEIVGFALLDFAIRSRKNREDPENPIINIEYVFVDVLCGNPAYFGVGSMILGHIENGICKPNLIPHIRLNSITEAAGFYLKRGFKCDPCKMRFNVKFD